MRVALVGQPNVGKSLVLNRLTGARVVVSNYPGTSVELSKGTTVLGGRTFEIIDTPGVYSISRASAEEEITRETILAQDLDIIINVLDATDLSRHLALTLELLEIGRPLLVILNQIDRARARGLNINHQELSRLLNCPVYPFSALTGEGVVEVLQCLERGVKTPGKLFILDYGPGEGCNFACASCGKVGTCERFDSAVLRHQKAREIASQVVRQASDRQRSWLEKLQRLIDHAWAGPPLLLLLALLGFKLLIGFTSVAEEMVSSLFAPAQKLLESLLITVLPHGFVAHVLSKAIPEGLIIPFALVMPAMLMVSILMSLLEDTGLLPRYAVALERIGSMFGVSGQAVIPLSLGFGCRTPAVVATRILANPSERFIVITLLSIVIPCAATMGMLTSVIATFHAYLLVIALTMLAAFVLLGLVLKRRYGVTSDLVYELPVLRMPVVSNLIAKIKMRFGGFFTEVLPLLLVMSVGVRALIESGVLNHLSSLEPITKALFGIPAQAFIAVLVTIVQRYLAPLVLLNLTLTPREATIAISMVALSLPCLPVMVMTLREAGGKALLKIIGLGLMTSFSVGVLLNIVLPR